MCVYPKSLMAQKVLFPMPPLGTWIESPIPLSTSQKKEDPQSYQTSYSDDKQAVHVRVWLHTTGFEQLASIATRFVFFFYDPLCPLVRLFSSLCVPSRYPSFTFVVKLLFLLMSLSKSPDIKRYKASAWRFCPKIGLWVVIFQSPL